MAKILEIAKYSNNKFEQVLQGRKFIDGYQIAPNLFKVSESSHDFNKFALKDCKKNLGEYSYSSIEKNSGFFKRDNCSKLKSSDKMYRS